MNAKINKSGPDDQSIIHLNDAPNSQTTSTSIVHLKVSTISQYRTSLAVLNNWFQSAYNTLIWKPLNNLSVSTFSHLVPDGRHYRCATWKCPVPRATEFKGETIKLAPDLNWLNLIVAASGCCYCCCCCCIHLLCKWNWFRMSTRSYPIRILIQLHEQRTFTMWALTSG